MDKSIVTVDITIRSKNSLYTDKYDEVNECLYKYTFQYLPEIESEHFSRYSSEDKRLPEYLERISGQEDDGIFILKTKLIEIEVVNVISHSYVKDIDDDIYDCIISRLGDIYESIVDHIEDHVDEGYDFDKYGIYNKRYNILLSSEWTSDYWGEYDVVYNYLGILDCESLFDNIEEFLTDKSKKRIKRREEELNKYYNDMSNFL